MATAELDQGVRWKDAERPEDVTHPERLPMSRSEMMVYLSNSNRDRRRHTLNRFWSGARTKKSPLFADWVRNMEAANVLLDVTAGVFDED